MRKSFKRATLVLALGTALPLAAVSAATPLGLVTGTTPFTSSTLSGTFEDLYNFTVAPNDKVGIAATSVSFTTYGALTGTLRLYEGTYALLSQLTGRTPLPVMASANTMFSPNGTNTTTIAAASNALSPANTYTLLVEGTSKGVAAYVGVIALTPVPEPRTYAMLAVGMGMVGLMLRRRRDG